MSEEGAAKLEQCQGHVDGFLYHEGVINHEYAPPGQTLTKVYIIKVLCRLRDAIRRKQQHFWANCDWQNITLPRSVRSPTAQIWLSATSGFSES